MNSIIQPGHKEVRINVARSPLRVGSQYTRVSYMVDINSEENKPELMTNGEIDVILVRQKTLMSFHWHSFSWIRLAKPNKSTTFYL